MGILSKTIGKNVVKLRLDRGWTQAHLAEYSQISIRQIQAIESGDAENYPREKTMYKIAEALGVSPLRLFEAPEFTREPTIPEALRRVVQEFGFDLKTRRKPRAKPNTPPSDLG